MFTVILYYAVRLIIAFVDVNKTYLILHYYRLACIFSGVEWRSPSTSTSTAIIFHLIRQMAPPVGVTRSRANDTKNTCKLFHIRSLHGKRNYVNTMLEIVSVVYWPTCFIPCYASACREGGNKRCFCPSVRPHVCLSVRPSRT